MESKGTIDNFFVGHSASSDVRSVNNAARTQRDVVSAANGSRCARFSGLETTSELTLQHFRDIYICMETVKIAKTLKESEDSWGANDDLFGVVTARNFVLMKRTPKALLAVSICIANKGSPSSYPFVFDQDRKINGS